MTETRRMLFDGPAGEETAKVWLEADGCGAVICTHSWGPGVERHFGHVRRRLEELDLPFEFDLRR